MSIASLASVLKVFGGHKADPEERAKLLDEALLMTLARATSSDSNISPVEVASVQRVIKAVTGHEVTEADVRVAAKSELFESQSLGSVLARIRDSLTVKDRAMIARSLAEVIRSDAHVSELELDYFDQIAASLKIRPSELLGLHTDD